LLAKVFVIIVAVLSFTFLGVTATLYQHKKDWRGAYGKLRERYKVMAGISAKEIDQLRAGIKAKDAFIQSKQVEVSDLKKWLDLQNAELSKTKTDLNTEKNHFENEQRMLKQTTDQKQQTDKELLEQKQRNDDLHDKLDAASRRREIAEGQVARLTQLKTSLEKDLSDLRQMFADTRKSLKDKELVLALLEENGVNVTSIIAGPPVPSIDAKVAGVKDDVSPALVLLSVGSDDKVERGFHFSIYRGSEFIGKVIVEKVLKDSCGCRVLFTKEGAKVQAGDSAATRLQ
jgi:hypothetical protein